MLSAYRQLLQLPLFQGITAERLSELIERYPFHFLKYADGASVSEAGDAVDHVRFVVSGKVRLTTRFEHLNVSVEQTIEAPDTLGTEHLFGRDNALPYRVVSEGPCGIMQLRKTDYVEMLQSDRIFLFNILNYLSNSAQRRLAAAVDFEPGSAAERLLMVLNVVLLPGARDIAITYRQRDLSLLLGCQRMALLTAIEDLTSRGLATYDGNRLSFDGSLTGSSREG